MLEIGLNGLLLDRPHSGTATYTRHLAPLLPLVAPDLRFRLFTRHPASTPSGVAVDRLRTPLSHWSERGGPIAQLEKLAWEEIALPAASAARGEALLHSLYFAVPAVTRCPVVVTVHDLIPLVVPGYHHSRQSALYTALMARLLRRAAAVITVSQHAKWDIVSTLAIPESRVHVTPEAADERFQPDGQPGELDDLRARYRLAPQFVLYLGGAERRKGIETLVRAWRTVARAMREREVQLVVVANFPAPDALYPDIPGLVRDLGLQSDVVLLPSVREEDKPALYRAALLFAFPSTYEGFGLTPLEAMASGLPVLASNATSIPEVVGNGGMLLPPGDPAAWGAALLELVDSESERMRLAAAGIERARRFSWEETARETVRVYREVLGR